jgi:hypothetical protein
MMRIAAILFLVLLFMASFVSFMTSVSAGENDVVAIKHSIKNLSLAVELWANNHKGKFPTSREFYSSEFLQNVKKVDPEEAKNKLCCPVSGYSFSYECRQAEKDYIISCPRPRNCGLKALYYQRSKGVIVEKPL